LRLQPSMETGFKGESPRGPPWLEGSRTATIGARKWTESGVTVSCSPSGMSLHSGRTTILTEVSMPPACAAFTTFNRETAEPSTAVAQHPTYPSAGLVACCNEHQGERAAPGDTTTVHSRKESHSCRCRVWFLRGAWRRRLVYEPARSRWYSASTKRARFRRSTGLSLCCPCSQGSWSAARMTINAMGRRHCLSLWI
jgi:hypothetical protein